MSLRILRAAVLGHGAWLLAAYEKNLGAAGELPAPSKAGHYLQPGSEKRLILTTMPLRHILLNLMKIDTL